VTSVFVKGVPARERYAQRREQRRRQRAIRADSIASS
jgi:hypothetical protein